MPLHTALNAVPSLPALPAGWQRRHRSSRGTATPGLIARHARTAAQPAEARESPTGRTQSSNGGTLSSAFCLLISTLQACVSTGTCLPYASTVTDSGLGLEHRRVIAGCRWLASRHVDDRAVGCLRQVPKRLAHDRTAQKAFRKWEWAHEGLAWG